MNRFSFVVVLALACFAPLALVANDPPAPGRPVDVFHGLDGTWSGVFVGYDSTGRELYRIRVRQEYETIDDTTQRVTVVDTMPDGTIIRGEGENTATRRPDGSLTLKCIVRKSNGERVEHDGRLAKGPDGEEQLVWYSQKKNRTETFLETVRNEGSRVVYEINGMGQYGETRMLMQGRYLKQ